MAISNFDILNVAKYYKLPLNGVFMKDTLPSVPKNGGYVVNLDSSTDPRDGTHWCMIYLHNKDVLYVDSYGQLPTQETINFMNKVNKHWGWNVMQYQSWNSELCGFYSLAAIMAITIGLDNNESIFDSFDNFSNMFNIDPNKNDRILQQYFMQFKHKNKVIQKMLNEH